MNTDYINTGHFNGKKYKTHFHVNGNTTFVKASKLIMCDKYLYVNEKKVFPSKVNKIFFSVYNSHKF